MHGKEEAGWDGLTHALARQKKACQKDSKKPLIVWLQIKSFFHSTGTPRDRVSQVGSGVGLGRVVEGQVRLGQVGWVEVQVR